MKKFLASTALIAGTILGASLLFESGPVSRAGYVVLPPESGGGGGAVDSVNGQTGTVVLTKSDLSLGNVDNTSDANKPVSTATQTALDLKAVKPVTSRLTADSTHKESDGATAITDLNVAVAASTQYIITCYITYSSASQAVIDLAHNYPASYVFADFGSSGPNEVLSVATSRTPANGSTVVRFLNVGGTFFGSTTFYINFKNGVNAGTVAFRWISKTSGDVDTTIFTGSFCESRIVP